MLPGGETSPACYREATRPRCELAEGCTSTQEVSFWAKEHAASAVRTQFFVTVAARARAARLAGCEEPSPRGVK